MPLFIPGVRKECREAVPNSFATMPISYPLDDDTQVSTPQNRLRRQLLKGTLGTAIVAALAYVGWTRWLFPPETPLPQEQGSGGGTPGLKLGLVSEFALGSPPKLVSVPIPQTDRVAAYFVENVGPGAYRVLSAKCTHQGCTVGWNPTNGRFLCPCHGARFDLAGKVLASPATKPLPVVPTHVENGVLYVSS